MPYFCSMDNGWPKKRCYVMKPPKYRQCHCRHWLKGIDEHGCGEGMWKIKCGDGDSLYLRIYGGAKPEKGIHEHSPLPNKKSNDGE